MVPQFVRTTAVYVRRRFRRCLERRRLGFDDGAGAATALQPSRVLRCGAVAVAGVVVDRGCVAVVVVASADRSSSLPHATRAMAASRITMRTSARRTAAERNGSPGMVGRLRAQRPHATQRSNSTAVPLTALVTRYDHFLLDLDGTVWVGDEPTPGAVDAVAALRTAGKCVTFVTNDTQLGTEEYVRKLWRLGFQASLEEVVTVGGALQFVLAERFQGRAAVVIGSEALHRHVEAAGLRIVNATTFASRADVVVVAFHPRFNYDELREATQAALRGAFLIGSNRDATFPAPDGLWPGSGAVIAAVETASGRTVTTVGKPEPTLVQTALDRLGPGRALMVGDRVDADLGAAHAAGIDGAIVLTGASDRETAEAATEPRAVAIAERLQTLVLG